MPTRTQGKGKIHQEAMSAKLFCGWILLVLGGDTCSVNVVSELFFGLPPPPVSFYKKKIKQFPFLGYTEKNRAYGSQV